MATAASSGPQLTFTHGLLAGQLSVIILLAFLLKYLLLDTRPREEPLTQQRSQARSGVFRLEESNEASSLDEKENPHSSEWFNLLIQHIVQSYRLELQGRLSGHKGYELARERVEEFVNRVRPSTFLDHVEVHSVELGRTAPRVSSTRVQQGGNNKGRTAELDISYTDTTSLSISTSVLFNYPMPFFARLPVSLTISLSNLSATVVLTPPTPDNPSLTIALQPGFILELETTSLLGSRAKLADVPKLHDLIEAQARRVLAERGIWKIHLPFLNPTTSTQQNVE